MQMNMVDTIVRRYVESETEFIFHRSLILILLKLVGVFLFYNPFENLCCYIFHLFEKLWVIYRQRRTNVLFGDDKNMFPSTCLAYVINGVELRVLVKECFLFIEPLI